MKIKILLLTSILFSASNVSANAGDCGPTTVSSVDVGKAGTTWIRFANKTQFAMKPAEDVAARDTLSLAMAAFATNAQVKINMGDLSQCGKGGNATSWRYVIMYK